MIRHYLVTMMRYWHGLKACCELVCIQSFKPWKKALIIFLLHETLITPTLNDQRPAAVKFQDILNALDSEKWGNLNEMYQDLHELLKTNVQKQEQIISALTLGQNRTGKMTVDDFPDPKTLSKIHCTLKLQSNAVNSSAEEEKLDIDNINDFENDTDEDIDIPTKPFSHFSSGTGKKVSKGFKPPKIKQKVKSATSHQVKFAQMCSQYGLQKEEMEDKFWKLVVSDGNKSHDIQSFLQGQQRQQNQNNQKKKPMRTESSGFPYGAFSNGMWSCSNVICNMINKAENGPKCAYCLLGKHLEWDK